MKKTKVIGNRADSGKKHAQNKNLNRVAAIFCDSFAIANATFGQGQFNGGQGSTQNGNQLGGRATNQGTLGQQNQSTFGTGNPRQNSLQQNNPLQNKMQNGINQQTNGLGGNIPLPSVRRDPNEQLPRPFPVLTPDHIAYLNQLLTYWETNSNKIKRYQCKFTNWTYNSMQVPLKDPQSQHVFAQTISVGKVQFADPDKGLFDMDKVWAFDKQLYTDKKDPFKENPDLRQKWHCDGKAVYEYLYKRKELVETPIPVEMQGEQIVDGPLPFLFGAKAADLKKRYWLRVITPKERGEQGEYWIEAYPKFRRDAANFQKVEIILEKKDFLPAVLTLFAPEHDLRTGRTIVKQTIKFENRKIWETEQAGLWGDALSKRPSTPFSWRRTVNELRDTKSRVSNNNTGTIQKK